MKYLSKQFQAILVLFAVFANPAFAIQDTVFHLTPQQLNNEGYLTLPPITAWKFRKGSDPDWARLTYDDSDWTVLDSASIYKLDYDEDGKFECWFRFQFSLDSGFKEHPYYLVSRNFAAQSLYLDGELAHSFGRMSTDSSTFKINRRLPAYLSLQPNKTYQLAVHFSDEVGPLTQRFVRFNLMGDKSFLWLMTPTRFSSLNKDLRLQQIKRSLLLVAVGVITSLFWLIWALNRKQQNLLMIAIFGTAEFLFHCVRYVDIRWFDSELALLNVEFSFGVPLISVLSTGFMMTSLNLLLGTIFLDKIPQWFKVVSLSFTLIFAPAHVFLYDLVPAIRAAIPVGVTLTIVATFSYLIAKTWKRLNKVMWPVIIGLGLTILPQLIPVPYYLGLAFAPSPAVLTFIGDFGFLIFPLCLLIYVALWFKETQASEQQKASELSKVTKEKQELLISQNERLEEKVQQRTSELNASLENLKSTQTQLIHSEKMASLGELTAGIAHEIQNPLNFVNNFSDLNKELIEEQLEELANGDLSEVKSIAENIRENEAKINHHGKRAEDIVKSMLQHSRGGEGEKELTDINTLADEYLRLAFHGLRAKDKSFNAEFKTTLDPDLPKVSVVPQDIGRVMLNLINNAFQAVDQKAKSSESDFSPTVEVLTKKNKSQIEITVQDNGPGIPEDIRDKIFQPFFTTKETGQGTGLGLSMSYDIITKGHGGALEVESREGQTRLIISIPIK